MHSAFLHCDCTFFCIQGTLRVGMCLRAQYTFFLFLHSFIWLYVWQQQDKCGMNVRKYRWVSMRIQNIDAHRYARACVCFSYLCEARACVFFSLPLRHLSERLVLRQCASRYTSFAFLTNLWKPLNDAGQATAKLPCQAHEQLVCRGIWVFLLFSPAYAENGSSGLQRCSSHWQVFTLSLLNHQSSAAEKQRRESCSPSTWNPQLMMNRQACAPRLIFIRVTARHYNLNSITKSLPKSLWLSNFLQAQWTRPHHWDCIQQAEQIHCMSANQPCFHMHAVQDTIVFFKECVTEKKKVLNNIRYCAQKTCDTAECSNIVHTSRNTGRCVWGQKQSLFVVSLLFNTHKRAHTVAHTHKHIIYTCIYIYMRT